MTPLAGYASKLHEGYLLVPCRRAGCSGRAGALQCKPILPLTGHVLPGYSGVCPDSPCQVGVEVGVARLCLSAAESGQPASMTTAAIRAVARMPSAPSKRTAAHRAHPIAAAHRRHRPQRKHRRSPSSTTTSGLSHSHVRARGAQRQSRTAVASRSACRLHGAHSRRPWRTSPAVNSARQRSQWVRRGAAGLPLT